MRKILVLWPEDVKNQDLDQLLAAFRSAYVPCKTLNCLN